jgi:hypothetical protein
MVTLRRVRATSAAVEKQIFWMCFQPLVSSMQWACTTLSSMFCSALLHFCTLSHKRHNFRKKKGHSLRMYFEFLYNVCPKHFEALSQNGEKRLLTSSCLSVRPPTHLSVCPHGILSSHCTHFHLIWYLRIFRKSVMKIKVSLKPYKNEGQFTWRPIYIFFIISRSFLLRMRNFYTHARVVEKIKTHILCS